MYQTKSKTKRFVAGLLGASLALSLAFAVTVKADTVSDLTAQIASLLATITGLQAQLSSIQGNTPSTGYTFSSDLKLGDTSEGVRNLQKVLNLDVDTQVSTGANAGAPGYETTYFGSRTKSSVIKWQLKHVVPGTGYVGPLTRAKLNAMSVTTTPVNPPVNPPVVVAPAGTGLTVSSPIQPAVTLAPESAARVPFTRITLTAGNDGDVTVNSLTVQRTGLAADAAFAGVVLLDENGIQIGIAKTFNSNHQATVGEPVVIPRGTSRTFTIAGNMATDNSTRAGQVATLTIVGVNTSATVTGSLPITGASQTINASLDIGTVTLQRGGTDPSSSQTKEIGTTDYTFSSVRVTAGSVEKVILKSFRWNQTGSAASGDISNIKTYVDGVGYATTVSSDGKYYTASFGTGIMIDKGFSKDISIKGDITGGSGRTIDFDIAKRTDIDLVGETLGYGIIPPQTGASDPTDDTAAFSSVEDPWYDAAQVTVSAGTLSVSTDSSVPATNISVNSNNQILGGYKVDVKGEPVSVSSIVFNIQGTGDEAENITNISLVDGSGAVLAGPVDGVSATTDSAYGSVTFSSSVTFPIGVTTLKLVGKLGTTFVSNDTVVASTTPSTQWTTVKGQVSGNTITPSPTSKIAGSTMTVRAAALAISQSSQPPARSVIAGAQQFEFARYILDAGQSGEDVRVTSLLTKYSFATNAANTLTNCKLYDGASVVSDSVSPASTHVTGDDLTFVFSGTGIIVSKGTSKTLSLKCDVSTSATSGSFTFGNDDNATAFTSASGIGSGQTVVDTWVTSAGQAMTSATGGSFTITEDTSLIYKVAQAGTTGVTLGRFRLSAGIAEDITIKAIALELAYTASSSPADLVGQTVSLYSGSALIGTATFNTDHATSTVSAQFKITRGEDALITVKGDLSVQNASEGTPGAFIGITIDGDSIGLANGTYAVGYDSGTNITPSTATDVTSDGLRIFRSVPTIAVTSSGGTLAASVDLYKFTVTNSNSRDLVLHKVSYSIATSGASTVKQFTLFGDNVAANATAVDPTRVETAIAGGQTPDALEIVFDATSQAKIVPANSSKTYVLKAATVSNDTTAIDSINIALLADTSYPPILGVATALMSTSTGINTSTASSTNNFIWSPFSTTSPVADSASKDNLDWTNGYGLPGFSTTANFPVQTWTSAN